MLHKIVTVAMLASMTFASPTTLNDVTVRSQPIADNSTFGNIDQIATTHVHLNLTADFFTSTLDGWAYHTMLVKE